MKKSIFLGALLVGSAMFLKSCQSVKVPSDITVVDNFKAESFMGQWYEIARFDFKYEKDLSNVTANYSLNNDGSVKVLNKGYNYVKKEWEEKEGKAKFVLDETKGALKVSFFGPFYSGYNVVALDNNYETALVFGETKDYIWILSRKKTISEDVKKNYIEKAKQRGYDLNRLVWTEQE